MGVKPTQRQKQQAVAVPPGVSPSLPVGQSPSAVNLKHNWKKFTIKTSSDICILMLLKKKKPQKNYPPTRIQNITSFRQGPLPYLPSRRTWKCLIEGLQLHTFLLLFPGPPHFALGPGFPWVSSHPPNFGFLR